MAGSTFKFHSGTSLPKPNLSTSPWPWPGAFDLAIWVGMTSAEHRNGSKDLIYCKSKESNLKWKLLILFWGFINWNMCAKLRLQFELKVILISDKNLLSQKWRSYEFVGMSSRQGWHSCTCAHHRPLFFSGCTNFNFRLYLFVSNWMCKCLINSKSLTIFFLHCNIAS